MIFVYIHRFAPVKQDLYTCQNTKISRFVDNMVDNVDKPMWITHAGFVNNIGIRAYFTHGKPYFFFRFLQVFLLIECAVFRRFFEETVQHGSLRFKRFLRKSQ